MARYIADGSPDVSFGGGGVVTTDSGGTERAYGVAIDNDGRIVVAGHAGGTGNDFAVARYNVDGTLDETFGDGGKVTTEVVGQADFAHAVALQPDGAIVVGGRAAPDGGGPFEFALVRYLPDGSLDPTFGSGGIALTDFGSDRDDSVQALAVGEDGTIVAAGYSTTNAHATTSRSRDLTPPAASIQPSAWPAWSRPTSGAPTTSGMGLHSTRTAGSSSSAGPRAPPPSTWGSPPTRPTGAPMSTLLPRAA